MRALSLDHAKILAAAQGRVANVRWRVGLGLVLWLGFALVSTQLAPAVIWLSLIGAAWAADYALGKLYIRGPAHTRDGRAWLFIVATAISMSVYAGAPLYLSLHTGAAGQVLAAFMAGASIVSVMLFVAQSPLVTLISAAPSSMALTVLAFAPRSAATIEPWRGDLAIALGVFAFLAYAGRAARNSEIMIRGLEHAHNLAQQRAQEAELRRVEAEEANRAKATFLAVMTHELRTPLNAVIGYAEIIAEDARDASFDAMAQDAGRITSSARHLLGLIDQILSVSSAGAGEERVLPRDIDLRAALEEWIAQVGGPHIERCIAPSAAHAHTDAVKLGVAIAALLSNAVKFGAGEPITVTVVRTKREGAAWIEIAVSDRGCGIDAADLAHIFGPFVQVDAAASGQGGLGLGLTIARRMARAIGGDIDATSTIGVGSTFTLAFPQHLSNDAQACVKREGIETTSRMR